MKPIKSILMTSLGALPGILLAIFLSNPYFLFIAFLGGFIGFAFSLPGTSLTRVASLTGSVFVQHNLPGIGGHLVDIVEKKVEAHQQKKRREESEYDFRKLPYVADLIRVDPSAVSTIQVLRPHWGEHAPIRANRWLASNGMYLVSLAYEDEWDSDEDIYTESNGIYIVANARAVPLLRGATIISPPNYDPAQFQFLFDDVAVARTEEPAPAETEAKGGFPWGIAFAVVVGIGAFVFQLIQNPPQNRQQNNMQNGAIAKPADNGNDAGNDLKEKMKRGEDIPEPLLILIGVDPQEYKKHQEKVREAKQEEETKPGDGVQKEETQKDETQKEEVPNPN